MCSWQVKNYKSLNGFTSLEGVILLSLVAIALGLIFSKAQLEQQAKYDEVLFSAAASFASGVIFAHHRWKENGHTEGDDIDDLQGFRSGSLNMTFNGWPRGITGSANHTNMSMESCTEIWNGFVEDRWQTKFVVNSSEGELGLCRFHAREAQGYVEYDVRRGRVVLQVG